MLENLAKSQNPEKLDYESLEILTFTGIDARTHMAEVYKLYAQYPRIEFGILVGSHSGDQKYRRFPSFSIVDSWRQSAQKYDWPLAIHLCGRLSRGIMNGQGLEEAVRLCEGFNRVQVNSLEYDYDMINAFADDVSCSSVILQGRESFDASQLSVHPKIEWLHDLSGGTGREDFDSWSAPSSQAIRCGYAGGLKPANIQRALAFVEAIPDHKVWLDMESGVRTADDWLNVQKVEAVCQAAFGSQ